MVPLQCEYYALEGITALVQTVEAARQELNPNLEIEGVVLTMHDGRTNLSVQIEKETRDYFGESVFQNVIPRNVKLSECPSFGQPIMFYDPASLGAGAYEALGRELDQKHYPYMLRSAEVVKPKSKPKSKRKVVAKSKRKVATKKNTKASQASKSKPKVKKKKVAAKSKKKSVSAAKKKTKKAAVKKVKKASASSKKPARKKRANS